MFLQRFLSSIPLNCLHCRRSRRQLGGFKTGSRSTWGSLEATRRGNLQQQWRRKRKLVQAVEGVWRLLQWMPAWRNLRTVSATGRRSQMAIKREEFCTEIIREKSEKKKTKKTLPRPLHNPFLLLPSSADHLSPSSAESIVIFLLLCHHFLPLLQTPRLVPSSSFIIHLHLSSDHPPNFSPRTQQAVICKSLSQPFRFWFHFSNPCKIHHKASIWPSSWQILPLHQGSTHFYHQIKTQLNFLLLSSLNFSLLLKQKNPQHL